MITKYQSVDIHQFYWFAVWAFFLLDSRKYLSRSWSVAIIWNNFADIKLYIFAVSFWATAFWIYLSASIAFISLACIWGGRSSIWEDFWWIRRAWQTYMKRRTSNKTRIWICWLYYIRYRPISTGFNYHDLNMYGYAELNYEIFEDSSHFCDMNHVKTLKTIFMKMSNAHQIQKRELNYSTRQLNLWLKFKTSAYDVVCFSSLPWKPLL